MKRSISADPTTLRTHRLLIIFLVALSMGLFRSPAVTAQQGAPSQGSFEEIDAYVEAQLKDSRLPGAAVAIVEGPSIVYSKGFGMATHMERATDQTAFPIGSISRSFTALAIMHLAETGLIDLGAPVTTYIPWFQGTYGDTSVPITVRHLLDQTSGLPEETFRDLYVNQILKEWPEDLEGLVAQIGTTSIVHSPGSVYEESEANYVVLALILQNITRQPYGEYITQRYLHPLGMNHSSATTVPENMVNLNRLIFGFQVGYGSAYLPEQFPGSFVVASANDMARYLSIYLTAGSRDGHIIASPAAINEALRPTANLAVSHVPGNSLAIQPGRPWNAGRFGEVNDARWLYAGSPYFTAWAVILPETNQAVVVLINAGSTWDIAGVNQVLSRIPAGVVNLLTGSTPPTGRSLSDFYIVFDLLAVALVTPAGLAVGRLFLLPTSTIRAELRGRKVTWRIVPLLWELGMGTGILLLFPAITNGSWLKNLLVKPDLTALMAVVGGLWLITGLLRLSKLTVALLPFLTRPGQRNSLFPASNVPTEAIH